MTNIYDVLSKLRVKATASAEESVKKDLEKEDPPIEEAKSILNRKKPTPAPESGDESTKGNDTRRSSQSNKQDM